MYKTFNNILIHLEITVNSYNLEEVEIQCKLTNANRCKFYEKLMDLVMMEEFDV